MFSNSIDRWLFGGCVGALGIAVAALAWWFARLVVDVPAEDRTYRDRPPLAFRVMWWPIQWLAFYLGPVVSIATRQRWIVRLRLAGVDFALSPEQFIASRVVAALYGAAMDGWLMDSFGLAPWRTMVIAAVGGYVFPGIWLSDRIKARRSDVLKTLPFVLDLITLCIEAGLNLTGALNQAAAKGPIGPLLDEIARVLRDIRAGKPRADALRTFADRMNQPAIANVVSAMIQAEAMGMNLGPVLRAQAEQRRTERFARAEKAAMEAPVKMLFPLIAFIFPCTFVVLAFPIVMKFLMMGL